MARRADCGQGIVIGAGKPPVIIAGPCVIESLEVCADVAERMAAACRSLAMPYIFKASFDKANRSSVRSFRGPGLEDGLTILAQIAERFSVPVLTDIHTPTQAKAAAAVVDVLQIPAFLCRQTDLLTAAGETGRCVNIKKGQFMAPEDMAAAVRKVTSTGNPNVMLTERGTTFGYHNLVVDMRALVVMRELGVPVVFDGTHAVQLPAAQGACSGGDRRYVSPLARGAAAVGVDGIFLEVHPDPDRARCDAANQLTPDHAAALLRQIKRIHECITADSTVEGRDS